MRDQLHELERLLGEMLGEHEKLLKLLKRKKQALQQAQPDVVTETCDEENKQVQKIAALEKRRQAVVGALTGQMQPDARQPLTLVQIADRLAEPQRGRLLTLQAQLRQKASEAQHEARVTRAATEGLLRHVQGMVQMVVQTVASAGTYERRGAMAKAAPAMSSSFAITG